MNSLRRRLLLPLILLPPLCAIPGAYWLYLNTAYEINRSYDYELIAISRALDGDTITQIDRQKPIDNGEDDDVCIQVWDKNGKLLYHTDDEIPPFPEIQAGLQTLQSPSGPWRSYTTTANGLILQIAQPFDAREELAFSATMRILGPLLLVLPIWALLAWITINRGLLPLGNITMWLSRRNTQSTSPLPMEGIPSEVAPMARALNDLLDRLDAASVLQRTFIADAAHALRTPLAVVRVQLEIARSASTDAERVTALDTLSLGIERASRLVQQLLTLAKQEPGAVPGEVAVPTPLDALLREVIAEAIPLAQAKNIDLGVTEAEPVTLSVDAVSVRALIANLVDNAIRYSHQGCRIDASINSDDIGARIEICDNGPGIPDEERDRVFDRFYRGVSAAESGSGLGLAIAMEIAQRHAGRVSLEDGFPTASGKHSRVGLKVIARLGNLNR